MVQHWISLEKIAPKRQGYLQRSDVVLGYTRM
jgi:hypothetical protein